MGKAIGVRVIGTKYCQSRMVELDVVRKVIVPDPDGTIFVGNRSTKVIFKIKDTSSSYGLHSKRVLLNAHDVPVITFRHKVISLHSRWRVYLGNSKEKKDLLFTAKHSSIMGSNKELNVFLVENKQEKICDFRVGASSKIFYRGDSRSSTNIIAEMSDGTVKVYPNVDQAFIVSLIVILDGMNQRWMKNEQGAKIVLEGLMFGAGIAAGI